MTQKWADVVYSTPNLFHKIMRQIRLLLSFTADEFREH